MSFQQYSISEIITTILAILGGIIVVSTFFEKLFDKKFVGKWFFALVRRIAGFFWKRFTMPFRKEIDGIKEIVFRGKHLEQKFIAFTESEKSKNDAFTDFMKSLDFIKSELTVNGGKSLKDSVNKLVESDAFQRNEFHSLRKEMKILTVRHDLRDESENKMNFRMNANLSCTAISDNFLRFFGYTEKDMLGLDWDFCILKSQRKNVRALWRQAIERKSQYRNERQTITDSKGIAHHCFVRGVPLIENGELTGFYGIIEVLEEEI